MLPAPDERIDPTRPRWFLRGAVAGHVKRYELLGGIVAGLRVMDVACGHGYGSAILAKHARSVVGIDVSRDTVAAAKAGVNVANVRLICADARKLPLDSDSIDVAVSFETIEHLSSDAIDEYLDEIHRVVRSSGRVYISTPDKDSYSLGRLSSNPFHLHELTLAELSERMGRRFAIQRMWGQEFAPAWQLAAARALARGPLAHPMQRLWRAYKYIINCSGDVIPIESRPRQAPMGLVVEALNRK